LEVLTSTVMYCPLQSSIIDLRRDRYATVDNPARLSHSVARPPIGAVSMVSRSPSKALLRCWRKIATTLTD